MTRTSTEAILAHMEWIGRGLLTAGLLWFLAATFVGGARSLMLSTALFLIGAVISAMG